MKITITDFLKFAHCDSFCEHGSHLLGHSTSGMDVTEGALKSEQTYALN